MNPFDDPDFREFVDKNAGADPAALRLKYHGDPLLSTAIVQIECRRKFARKLADTLRRCPRFFFPSALAGEQSTSDALAVFHASLIPEAASLTDLTAGLGIDVFHIAGKAHEVTAVEHKPDLAEALEWNAESLGLKNIRILAGDCVGLLISGTLSSEVAFIDPARRAGDGSRVFALSQCEPDVTAMLPDLRKSFRKLFIKASPMLDITQTVRDLPGVTDIYAVGTTTECKELLAVVDLEENAVGTEPLIHAVTVSKNGESRDFAFTVSEEAECGAALSAEISRQIPAGQMYVIEPLPAMMKAAPLKLFANRFGLMKIAPNTHIYVSKEKPNPEISGFGKIWLLEKVVPWASKNIKRLKNEYPSIDVAVRNFGMTADALRSKLGVSQGGSNRLLAVTDSRGERVMLVLKEFSE